MSKPYYHKRTAKSSLKGTSLPPVKSIFLQTFDFSSIRINQRANWPKIKPAEIETIIPLVPSSVINKLVTFGLQGGTKFIPNLSPRDLKRVEAKLQETSKHIENSYNENKYIENKFNRYNFNHSPFNKIKPQVCEVSLQTQDNLYL